MSAFVRRVEVDKVETKLASGKATKPNVELNGYCIVSGKSIPFNLNQPLSPDLHKEWMIEKDPNYKGHYCHFSGEIGYTTYSKPILARNWSKAKQIHGL